MKLGSPEPIAALNRVRILESGEPLVDVREACPLVVVAETACPYLRKTVAQMLHSASESLPPGCKYRVGTCLRTLAMQKGGWDSYFAKMKEEHPNWPLSALRRATNRYFAPYDQPAPPGHCTGGAVDVGLLGPDGEPVDVTSPTTGWDAAYTWSDKVSPQAKANRMIIVDAMLRAGFSNCRDEYWHYSYGDSAWAVRVGLTECPYGFIDPPVSVEARFSGGAAEAIRQTGDDQWDCRPAAGDDGSPTLLLGVFWAEGREIRLRIEWPGEAPQSLFRSPDCKEWEPTTFETWRRCLLLTLRPTTLRVYISSAPPPSQAEKPS